MDNGVWDGEYIYFVANDMDVFVRAFCRLHEKLHITFKAGKFALNILSPIALPEIASYMPPPKFYEHVVPLHCGWMSLNKSQLATL